MLDNVNFSITCQSAVLTDAKKTRFFFVKKHFKSWSFSQVSILKNKTGHYLNKHFSNSIEFVDFISIEYAMLVLFRLGLHRVMNNMVPKTLCIYFQPENKPVAIHTFIHNKTKRDRKKLTTSRLTLRRINHQLIILAYLICCM